jgi:hypothetical protein
VKGATSQSTATTPNTGVSRVRDWPGDHPPNHPLPPPGAPTAASLMQFFSFEGSRAARVAAGARCLAPLGSPPEDTAGRTAGADGSPAAPSSSGAAVELFTPDTLRRWHRELVRAKWRFPHRVVSRQRISHETQVLVWRMSITTRSGPRHSAAEDAPPLFNGCPLLAVILQHDCFLCGVES